MSVYTNQLCYLILLCAGVTVSNFKEQRNHQMHTIKVISHGNEVWSPLMKTCSLEEDALLGVRSEGVWSSS